MTERTERSEGHEGMPGRQSMRDEFAEPVVESAEPSAASAEPTVPAQATPAEFVRRPGVLRTILGRDQDDDDRPLPELPPLPADPRWRIEHLPMITAIGIALTLCGGSAGLLIGGPVTGLAAALGILVVVIGFTFSTLTIAWADVRRPQLVMPVGLAVYVIKYALIIGILLAAQLSEWEGTRAMAYGVAFGAVTMTAAQIWWISRLARRHLPSAP
jgi:hypothetical protein